ncbi:MAG: hypothetical protein M1812_001511, partial [Candelaria pacifica]
VHPTMKGQEVPESALVYVDNELEWDVKGIVDSRIDPEEGFLYRVQWEGNWEDTWELPANL